MRVVGLLWLAIGHRRSLVELIWVENLPVIGMGSLISFRSHIGLRILFILDVGSRLR
jgi:hypothetical protein